MAGGAETASLEAEIASMGGSAAPNAPTAVAGEESPMDDPRCQIRLGDRYGRPAIRNPRQSEATGDLQRS